MIWVDPTIPTLILCFFYKNVSSVLVQSPSGLLTLIHISHLFPPSRALKVQDIYELQLASFMYQFHHQLLPPDLLGDDIFNVDTPSHSYDTRHAHEPFITTTNIVPASNTSKSQGPQLWFQLPTHLKDSPSTASFKIPLKSSHQLL